MNDIDIVALQKILEDIVKKDSMYELRREHGKVIAIKIERKNKTCIG